MNSAYMPVNRGEVSPSGQISGFSSLSAGGGPPLPPTANQLRTPKDPWKIACATCCTVNLVMVLFQVIFIMIPLLENHHPLLDVYHWDSLGAADEDFKYAYLDGWNKVEINPTIHRSGFPVEMFYSLDSGTESWVNINETHMWIPYLTRDQWARGDRLVQAKFLQEHHGFDDVRAGVSIFTAQNNMLAGLSPRIETGTAERLHVFKTKKPLYTKPYERVQAEQRQRYMIVNWLAKALEWPRRFLMNTFYVLNRNSIQMREAGAMNTHSHKKIWEYADGAMKDNVIPPHMERNMTAMRGKLEDIFQNLKGDAHTDWSLPLTSLTTCMHWDFVPCNGTFANDFPGRRPGCYNASGMMIPLNTRLATYRGHVSYAPGMYFETSAGISIFHWNKNTEKYEIYVGMSQALQFGDEYDLTNPFQPSLIMGPVDGSLINSPADKNLNVGLPKREKIQAPSLMRHALLRFARQIPVDYTYLFGDYEKMCPRDRWEELDKHLSNTNFEHLSGKQAEPSLSQKNDFLMLSMRYQPCLANFLQPTIPYSHGYELYTISGGFHGIIEVPGPFIMYSLCGRMWNNIYSEDL